MAKVLPGHLTCRWQAAPTPERPAPMISTSTCSSGMVRIMTCVGFGHERLCPAAADRPGLRRRVCGRDDGRRRRVRALGHRGAEGGSRRAGVVRPGGGARAPVGAVVRRRREPRRAGRVRVRLRRRRTGALLGLRDVVGVLAGGRDRGRLRA